ncbi:hypothetical protein P153DRAFT_126130 [Dothidotthia symphoricarpi CBS 119687]|uniref:Protein BNI4 n=1 Tax=Dothidotthia symphoricarpi CBS 119687 TaxID=1392245 RepID=A0A6A6A0E9_9PLEO|nr:uncharacterized protein P153DRAFT_126130 [Dothidotthia symphoricarpi CBS 119687]KAF2124725.1 hypothetical protein P153DRAFT_126130 [Dothidotthia symphoricarpi CBS 119687]
MAQVLAPILQTSASITMPYSPPDAYQNAPGQPHQQQQQRSTQPPRNQMYNSHSGGTGYRGTSTPIAPYAFSSTPQLRQEGRSVSAPLPQGLQQQPHQPPPTQNNQARKGHPSHPSSSSDSTVSTSGSSSRSMAGPSRATKDDGDVKKQPEPFSASFMTSSATPDLSLSLGEAPVKPSPGRYRRGAGRTDSSSSVPTATSPTTPTQRSTPVALPPSGLSQAASTSPDDSDLSAPSRPGHNRASSADDSQLARSMDAAKRYRRRSFNGLDANGVAINMAASGPVVPPSQGSTTSSSTVGPGSSAGRQGSRPTSSRGHQRQNSGSSVSSNTSTRPQASNTGAQRASAPGAGDSVASKGIEAARRHAPSPLSHPVSNEAPGPAKASAPSSAAVKHLTAVNDKDKGMKSRLRRAFSFGSAAELRRASAENNISAERAKLRKDRMEPEEDPEQAAIIAKQEAAGIGAGIYSGQGGVGSTDNISIQSAASSASIMLRKMGSGMKKGSKSIKGLFRPKSVIGVPAADGPVNRPSVGRISMVTVEAERQKVNINADPHDQVRGGTGYPRLERNSIDAGQMAEIVNPSNASGETGSRKSIVGNDRERAEVLSSMKKGILKRNNTSSDSGSPVLRPVDVGQVYGHSTSGTPTNDKRRNDDYFAKPPRIPNGSTRSLPTTPQVGRNISFSPRIQFHDAWSPSDYDRRGDIATCNRLTPMLAQQIREEVNSFKMEMEVHEQSKPHTHFF